MQYLWVQVLCCSPSLPHSSTTPSETQNSSYFLFHATASAALHCLSVKTQSMAEGVPGKKQRKQPLNTDTDVQAYGSKLYKKASTNFSSSLPIWISLPADSYNFCRCVTVSVLMRPCSFTFASPSRTAGAQHCQQSSVVTPAFLTTSLLRETMGGTKFRWR